MPKICSMGFLRLEVTVCLTVDEAQELFNRCMNSLAEDTEASESALRKLALALEPKAAELSAAA